MKFILLIIVGSFVIISCSANKVAGEKKCFRKTKTLVKSHWPGKLTDNYFKLKNRNYFEYYERVVGLTKIKSFKGTYYQSNDTLYLRFCNDSIPDQLSGEAYIDNKNQLITLLGEHPKYDQRFGIRFDRQSK